MRRRKMKVQWGHDEATLKELYMNEQDPHLRIRFQALWSLRCGYRLAQTAEVLGVHIRTVQMWLCWYRQRGHGRSPYVSPQQISMLCDRASREEFFAIHEAVDWVWRHFGVRYTYWGMRSLFRGSEGCLEGARGSSSSEDILGGRDASRFVWEGSKALGTDGRSEDNFPPQWFLPSLRRRR